MPMKPSARLFHCARCHRQVWICSHCDYGNRYCGSNCSQPARRESLGRARGKYQSSRKGRAANANRQARFRQRQREQNKKVTHQGSTVIALCDSLRRSLTLASKSRSEQAIAPTIGIYCHVCGCDCDPFMRRHFLRPPIRGR